jgi:hypothetical protein
MSDDKEWKLKKIELELVTYGNDEGTYKGSVMFRNGDHESFKFRIKDDMAGRYIELIADDVVKGADNLAQDLIKSLGLKANP